MEVIYFSRSLDDKKDPFLSAVKNVVSGERVLRVSRVDEFKRRLEENRGRKMFAVIVAKNEEILIDTYFVHYLLKGIPSILVLPDREKHTAALGCRIGPDYTFLIDADVSHFMSAVEKILEKNREDISLNSRVDAYGSVLFERCRGHNETVVANF